MMYVMLCDGWYMLVLKVIYVLENVRVKINNEKQQFCWLQQKLLYLLNALKGICIYIHLHLNVFVFDLMKSICIYI